MNHESEQVITADVIWSLANDSFRLLAICNGEQSDVYDVSFRNKSRGCINQRIIHDES